MIDLNLLTTYCEQHSEQLPSYLHDLERETHLKTLAPRMLSGKMQGQILRFLVQLTSAESILEIGTFTGYATICMALGLGKKGKITTIEVNPELAHISSKYFEKSGLLSKINPIIGDATAILPDLKGDFDFIFIDAGKKDNEFYYDICIERVRSGGLILVDNVLWSGKVLEEEKDKHTHLIDLFNQKIAADNRVSSLYLPVRDGLAILKRC